MSFVGRNLQKQPQCPCILYPRTQGIISWLLPLLNSLYFLQFYIKGNSKALFLHLKSLKDYFNHPYWLVIYTYLVHVFKRQSQTASDPHVFCEGTAIGSVLNRGPAVVCTERFEIPHPLYFQTFSPLLLCVAKHTLPCISYLAYLFTCWWVEEFLLIWGWMKRSVFEHNSRWTCRSERLGLWDWLLKSWSNCFSRWLCGLCSTLFYMCGGASLWL